MNVTTQVDQIRTEVREALEKAGRSSGHEYSGTARADETQPLGRYFDHTLLKPEATADQFVTLCREAREQEAASVCVPQNRVALCREELGGSNVDICTVIGFPAGYATAAAKARDVEQTAADGAVEFDTVVPIGLVRDRNVVAVYDDVRAVVEAAGTGLVKVILETALLEWEDKVRAGCIAVEAGAAMLKTSTGFASGGATAEDVSLLRRIAGEQVGVKAAGGIRTLADTRAMIEAGADRIGASRTVDILAEQR